MIWVRVLAEGLGGGGGGGGRHWFEDGKPCRMIWISALAGWGGWEGRGSEGGRGGQGAGKS